MFGAPAVLTAGGRSEVDPARVSTLFHFVERSEKAGRSELADTSRVRPIVPLHHSGIEQRNAVYAVRAAVWLVPKCLHREFAASQLLGQFETRPMRGTV